MKRTTTTLRIPRLLTGVLFALAICPGPSVRAQTTDSITLTQVQKAAARLAEDVLIAEQELAAAELNLRAFEASLKPRLDLQARLPNYFRTSNEVTQDDGTIAFREVELNNSSAALVASQRIGATGGTVGLETRLQRTDNFAQSNTRYQGSPVRLTLRQPILAFNPLKWDRRLLPLERAVAESRLTAARADATLLATDAFFQLVSADQERRIAQTNRATNETLYRIATERYALGQVNRGDLVQLQLELASAEQNLLRAERLVTAASADIADLTGIAYDGQALQPATPETGRSFDATAAYQRLRQRPEILDLQRQTLAAERESERTQRDLGPQLDLFASFGFVRADPALEPIYTDPQNERILSLQFTVPLLDWGERRARTERVKTQAELTRQLNVRTENRLDGQLRQLLQQWQTVQTELDLATQIRDLGEERFRISQESYRLGAIPLAELTIAQQTRDQNTRAYAATLKAYWLTYASLARLTLWDFINDRPL